MGRGAHRALVGKPEGKRPLWRPRHRWEDNTKNGSSRDGREAWTRLIGLRTETGGRFL